jgi:hypothetical protein
VEGVPTGGSGGKDRGYFIFGPENHMMQRLLYSRNLLAYVMAMATGFVLYRKAPFPDQNFFLELTFLRARPVFLGAKYSYIVSLYTTPYIAYSILLSGIYIFALKVPQKVRPGHLPLYPDSRKREDLFLIIGEIHNARTPGSSPSPRWLTIPERGLFTGIAIFGAVGSGKTSCCIFPFAEQILAYRAADQHKKIGGLVLEVKGDFCRQVKAILEGHGRGEDYVEISLGSPYRYNPLHNDLDAYALAYSIASLLNNLFGKGKDPAATDSTRVLRMPGFLNKKYDEEFVIKAEQHSERVHHPLDFKLRIDPIDSPYQVGRRNPAKASSAAPRTLTQSDHDWGFAKRALSRGTDPEEVVRAIAQYREGEKYDPLDYARRTVDKAQQALSAANKPPDSPPTEQPDLDGHE